MPVIPFNVLLIFINVLLYVKAHPLKNELPMCDGGSVLSLASGMNDVVVSLNRSTRHLLSTPINVVFGKFGSVWSIFKSRKGIIVYLYINGNKPLKRSNGLPVKLVIANRGVACFQRSEDKHKFTFEDLEMARLKDGNNPSFLYAPTLGITIHFNIFVVRQSDRYIISDIDGTITYSDLAGQILPLLGWSNADHHGIVHFFKALHRKNYQFIYLTSRSYVIENFTKNYLFKTLRLPMGPVLMSPLSYLSHMGPAMSNSSAGKTAILKSLLAQFSVNHIMGAYGNRPSDKKAYLNANIDPRKIWIINEQGIITNGRSGVPNIGMKTFREQLRNINVFF